MSWRDEVILALDQWLRGEGGARKPAWRRVGRAVRTGQDGTYTIDTRGIELNPDQMGNLKLAGPEASDVDGGYAVIDLVQAESTQTVRVAKFAELDDPYLWMMQQPTTFLIEAIRNRIDELGEAPLAERLAAGRPTGVLADVTTPVGLFPAQVDAYRACMGSGLWLVWGPPGTGKTMVLARAMADLLRKGSRVLLVSATNIAVDNALLGLVRAHRFASGEIVRVGTPQLRAIAEDASISLNLILRERLEAQEQERRGLENELADLRLAEQRLSHLKDQLAGFDAEAYAEAVRQLRAPGWDLAAVETEDARTVKLVEDLDAQITGAGVALVTAREAYVAGQPDRESWRRADELHQTLTRANTAAEDAATAVEQHQPTEQAARAAVSTLAELGWLRGLLATKKQQTAKEALTAAEEQQRHLERLAEQARTFAEAKARSVRSEIEQLFTHVSRNRQELNAEEARLVASSSAFDRLKSERSSLALRLRESRHHTRRVREAVQLVRDAEQAGLPALQGELERLEPLTDGGLRRQKLLDRYQEATERYAELSRDAQKVVIDEARLVATTLARFRTNRAIFSGDYDVVLVDEVGAATLAEVLVAVGSAGRTAVLLGDFKQLAAVLPDHLKRSTQRTVRTWLLPDVFAHCGITDADSARNSPGCITLDTQSRFGPTVMGLVNEVAYGGILRPSPQVRARPAGEIEIVLLDTDGLAELGTPHLTGPSKGWWPAGVLLSRALVELHQSSGEGVGVITPYADQAAATLEALRDVEDGPPLADVGTTHRFQGREFPVVVFDTVESAELPLWMSRASRLPGSGWPQEGLRLFNVAVTRTQVRLYLLASARGLAAARQDSPLASVFALRNRATVQRIPATALIAPAAGPDLEEHFGSLGGELRDVLARHVEVTAIDDELSFYAAFEQGIQSAQHSIWIWAPWVTEYRFDLLLPALKQAKERGVRVVVFLRDENDVLQRQTVDLVQQIKDDVGQAVPMNVMHQKIVVLDERTVMIGSLNVFSQRWTREVMLTMRGAHFAHKLLNHEHAEAFARVPRCPECGRHDVELRRSKPGEWRWRCYNRSCPTGGGQKAWKKAVNLAPRPRSGH